MKRKVLLIVPALLGMIALCGLCEGAGIAWGTGEGGAGTGGAVDWDNNPLPGIRAFGVPNLSNGALVQLYKAVGGIDETHNVMEAYQSTSWVIDDILLDQVHVGYGIGPPGQPANGQWSRTTNVDIAVGDTLYARIYNLPQADWAAAGIGEREVGIRDTGAAIIQHTVATVDVPQTYFFDNMQTEPIPEPASLLVLVPGLAVWALRRKK